MQSKIHTMNLGIIVNSTK